MKLWIDNTGLHSAGRCFYRQANNISDVKGLLQLTTQLLFADRLFINGFETNDVAEKSESLRDIIIACGLEKNSFTIVKPSATAYWDACLAAAESAAEGILDGAFNPYDYSGLGTTPDLDSRNLDFEIGRLHHLLQNAKSEKELQEIAEESKEHKAVGAVGYALAACPNLWHSIRKVMDTRSPWLEGYTWHLNGFLRGYLNHAFAGRLANDDVNIEDKARKEPVEYSPAVERAKILRGYNSFILDRLSKNYNDIIEQIRGKPLLLPSFAAVLVEKSNGQPLELLKITLEYRERLKPLRKWLTNLSTSYNLDHPEDRFEADRKIRNLLSDLAIMTGIPAKVPMGSLERAVNIGIAPISLSVGSLVDWAKRRLRRRKVEVLSEFSKHLIFLDFRCFNRLCRNCNAGTSDSEIGNT